MPIVELDMLIAFVNALDRNHKVANTLFVKIKEKKVVGTKVATSAYLEYELIHKSRGYPEKEIRAEIEAFRNYPNLDEEELTSEIILKASELREKFNMTYFDSLHAATAVHSDKKIISLDLAYEDIEELTRMDPKKLR
ncbi:MAG: PIN domain-containing protein [Euryarchaeota archaeon]|nr:PIN domain-containing protein [Euryarchaeota archaeon]